MKIRNAFMLIKTITSRGSVSLFAIVFVIALVTGIISLIVADKCATPVALTAVAGVLTTMSLNKATGLFGMRLAATDNPGTLATIIAVLIVLAFI